VVYEWDAKKAKGNRRKHQISFEYAATVFLDPLALTFPDPDHSIGEEREITVGRSSSQQVSFVSHCPRRDRVRIMENHPRRAQAI
jgi:hypothetical protein